MVSGVDMRGKRGPRDLTKKTIPQLQNTLWPLFALYIKLKWSQDGTYVNCFTCDKTLTIGDRDCQAGHFIPRTYSPTKYDEDNVYPQCSRCNEFLSGHPVEFEARLKDWIGVDGVEDLKDKAREPWKWDRDYLIHKIEHYREVLKELEE
jgi:hypothetical protein